jgi:hypothetical protein
MHDVLEAKLSHVLTALAVVVERLPHALLLVLGEEFHHIRPALLRCLPVVVELRVLGEVRPVFLLALAALPQHGALPLAQSRGGRLVTTEFTHAVGRLLGLALDASRPISCGTGRLGALHTTWPEIVV